MFRRPRLSRRPYSTKTRENWQVYRLPNTERHYPGLHGPYQGYELEFDQKFKPVCIATNLNPLKPIDDIIISRRRNKNKERNQADEIAITAAAKAGVTGKFLKSFHEANVKFDILNIFQSDHRVRVRIINSCETTAGQENIEKFISALHDMSSFTPLTRQVLADLCKPKFRVTPRLRAISKDKEFQPGYINRAFVHSYLFSLYYANYKEDDHHIPQQLPPIHQAIYNNDLDAVKVCLQQNPGAINSKDPWGIRAHELVSYLGSHEMYLHCYNVRWKLPPTSIGESMRLRHEQAIFTWPIKEDEETYWKINQTRLMKNRIEYDKVLKLPIPVRSELHLACIHGDIARVATILKQAPGRLNEQDVRGYTPLVLAVANGHASLVTWLLEHGASIEHTFFRDPLNKDFKVMRLTGFTLNKRFVAQQGNLLRPIDNAFDPAVMLQLLRHHMDPHEFNNRFEFAIYQNDVEIAAFMSHYLSNYPNKNGLSMLDLAVRESTKFGSQMVETILRARNEPVPEGPYDLTFPEELLKTKAPKLIITPEVAQAFELHNKNYHKREERKALSVKFAGEKYNIDNAIHTIFASKERRILSIVKPIPTLTPAERAEIDRIFFVNFALIDNDTQENQQAFIDNELKFRENVPAFVDLFHDETNPAKLLAFLCYEIISPQNEDFIIFHVRLGASDPQARQAAHGLLALACRASIATKSNFPDKTVYIYAEAIYPGLGLLPVLPDGQVDVFPIYSKSTEISRKLAKIVEVTLEGKGIQTKLKVRNAPNKQDNMKLHLFSIFNGGNIKQAMMLWGEINDAFIQSYLKGVAHQGVNNETLLGLTEYLRENSRQVSPRTKTCSQ